MIQSRKRVDIGKEHLSGYQRRMSKTSSFAAIREEEQSPASSSLTSSNCVTWHICTVACKEYLLCQQCG
ncbi:hypothetical protein OPV22_019604 [Ensete ventricosum]|uniref:Uncharacterized protein n=1 Tax=Ensete ventricosum TaxID=4639 RepID=A0AAV8QJJ8_ENSVE|nr:hypothetical protein OPV22_019604 [Ensete ventricosum]